MQVQNLLQAFALPKEKQERIFEIYFTMVQPRLIRCMEIYNRLYSEVEKVNREIEEKGIQTQSGGRVISLPHIMQLEEDVETYLYNAKSVLRDLARLFEPFFDKCFDHSKYNKIYRWALERFGENKPLPDFLKKEQDWIKDVVQRRNAVEHPGGYSEHLFVENYQMVKEGGLLKIVPPTWHLNKDKPSLLLIDLGMILENLLVFSEDLLVACLRQYGSRFPIVFYEIPEGKRDPAAPVRLGVTLDIEKLKA